MDYEKKYKEALGRAKEMCSMPTDKATMEYIFPELRESEDERMMREFNDWLCEEIECRTNDLRDEKDRRTLNMLCYILTKVKDWLEKQQESLHVQETCKENADSFTQEIPMPNSTELIEMWHKEEAMLKEKDFRGDTWRIAYNAFLDGFAQGMMVKQKEQKKDNPLEDFSKGYNTGYYHGRTDSEQKPELVQHPPITYTYPSDASRDEQLKMALLALLNSDLVKVTGKKFTKQDLIDWVEQKPDIELIQRSWYMEGYNDRKFGMEPRWIVKTGEGGPKHEKNPRYGQHLEPKPAEWSEEDEKMIDTIVSTLGQYIDYKAVSGTGSGYATPRYSKEIDWLKSLRPSWKPSEEQMAGLETAISTMRFQLNVGDKRLNSLYEQLKKLM